MAAYGQSSHFSRRGTLENAVLQYSCQHNALDLSDGGKRCGGEENDVTIFKNDLVKLAAESGKV
jgi:hypothetical protein